LSYNLANSRKVRDAESSQSGLHMVIKHYLEGTVLFAKSV